VTLRSRSAAAGAPTLASRVDSFFEITDRGSSVRTELWAGLSTFLALSYIVIVNPTILAEAGIDWSAAFFATTFVSGVATILMGLWARLPFALAPGMEMNAYIAYFVVGSVGFTWAQALGAVFWSGVLFVAVSAFGVRKRVLDSIPGSLKASLALSVGIFIAMIALKISGLLKFDELRIVGFGDILSAAAMALIAGLLVILVFAWRRIPGGVLVSVVVTALALAAFGAAGSSAIPRQQPGHELAAFGRLDFAVIFDWRALSIILVLFLIDFYGSVAKLVGLSAKTTLETASGLPRLQQALLTDSGATVIGSIVGTSNTTVYVESGVGIAAGGRTGLTALVCGIGFLVVGFLGFFGLGPLIQYIPVTATTGALLFVAITLVPKIDELRKMDLFELAALMLMQITVLLTAAIDKALLVGAIAYTLRSLVQRRWPNPYLLGSALVLIAGYSLQELFL